MRLGFSEKQAQSILNYRAKGGRFRRPSDFAKSYVVADSVFDRLEPYIDIPRIDLNKADSAAFETLPGIGPYFASKMVSYRTSLGGYSHPEQLLEIYHFDREKYEALKDLISCSLPEPYPIWTLSERDGRFQSEIWPDIRTSRATRPTPSSSTVPTSPRTPGRSMACTKPVSSRRSTTPNSPVACWRSHKKDSPSELSFYVPRPCRQRISSAKS